MCAEQGVADCRRRDECLRSPFFSVGVATFPGELANEHVPHFRVIPAAWKPHWSKAEDWKSLHELVFAGTADEVSGRQRALFSNRLVLTDQSFVDPDKLDNVEVSHSVSGGAI